MDTLQRATTRTCPVCGVSFRAAPSNPKRCCGRGCAGQDRRGRPSPKPKGAAHGLWKGGRRLNESGYVALYVGGGREVLEHRQVMEQALGRPLLPTESVHHRNGARDDNRLENLELWITSQPRGQRPEDLVAWAREILALYG